jgi:small conductance mechanosensitive channel
MLNLLLSTLLPPAAPILAQAGDDGVSGSEAPVVGDEVTEENPLPVDPVGEEKSVEEATGLVTDAVTGDWEAAVELGLEYGLPALLVLLVLIVAYFVGKLLSRAVSKPVTKKVDPTLGKFFGKLVFWAIMVGALLGVLGKFGVNIATFAAIVAAAGFAIGLAFQGTLANFAAGIMLLVFRPFKVGDVVKAAGVTAKVTEIDLFFTIFDTFDNRRIIVPNSDVSSGTIENITHHPVRRAEVKVGTAYDADLDAARAALEKAAGSIDTVQQGEGRGTQVMLMELGGSSIDWVVRAWFSGDDFWTSREQLIQAIKRELDAAGVGIPFPQMDVHLDGKVERPI